MTADLGSILFESKVPEADSRSLVILDRDGVLTDARAAYHVKAVGDLRLIPGTRRLISALKNMGATIVIASNQSWVGAEPTGLRSLKAVHTAFLSSLPNQGQDISATRYCIHRPEDACSCRKPNPGMIIDFLRQYSVSRANSVMIGDSATDEASASAAAVNFLRYAPLEPNACSLERLLQAVTSILKH